MTDQLFLSIWLDRHARRDHVRNFEKTLRLFPFSQREQPQSVVSIQAISTAEPPLLERALNGPLELDTVSEILRDYQGDDIAYVIESWWDLWQLDRDWSLRPARVALACFGPEIGRAHV